MGRKPKIPSGIKIEYVERILAGKASIKATARELEVHKKSVQEWIAKYRADGDSGPCPKRCQPPTSMAVPDMTISHHFCLTIRLFGKIQVN